MKAQWWTAVSLLACLAMADRALADMGWAIFLVEGYPIVGFDATTTDGEVVFLYDYTGTISADKYLGAALFMPDCVTPADSALSLVNQTYNQTFEIQVDVIQALISSSQHYTAVNDTAAVIDFCLRVDYYYVIGQDHESVNFHETVTSIDVDLTANFSLSGIGTETTEADQALANARVDYPVEAYLCHDNNTERIDAPPLTQGQELQLCVKIDDTVVDNVYVEDIYALLLSQPDGTTTTKSTPITNFQPDFLTSKTCREDGICNIRTTVPSKFFNQVGQTNLRVDGVAVLAFGVASSAPSEAPAPAPGGRRLRVPVTVVVDKPPRPTSRALEDTAESLFELEVGLLRIQVTDPAKQAEQKNMVLLIAIAALVVGVVFCACCGLARCCLKRRKRAATSVYGSPMQSSCGGPTLATSRSTQPSLLYSVPSQQERGASRLQYTEPYTVASSITSPSAFHAGYTWHVNSVSNAPSEKQAPWHDRAERRMDGCIRITSSPHKTWDQRTVYPPSVLIEDEPSIICYDEPNYTAPLDEMVD